MPKKQQQQPAAAAPGILGRARAAVAAFKAAAAGGGDPAANERLWHAIGGGGAAARIPGGTIDWRKRVGVLWENPAPALCVQFLFDKVSEPTLALARRNEKGKWVDDPDAEDHPALQLLRAPNPMYDGTTLRQVAALSYKFAGEAYILKRRQGGVLGPVSQLWYVPHWQIGPVTPEDGGPTRVYERRLPSGQKEFYAAGDVIHIKNGMDPQRPRHGFNVFGALLPEVATDRGLTTFLANIVANLGVSSGLASSADGENALSPTERDMLKDLLDERTTGEAVGQWVVSSLPISVQRIGLTPGEMGVQEVGERPEARICAACGFNPMALGLPSDDKKYANLKESREAAIENGIRPMLDNFDEALTQELLAEMEPGAGRLVRLQHNYDEVRDLRPDQDKEHARAVSDFKGGIMLLSEARSAINLEKDPQGTDGYAWQLLPKAKPGGAGGSEDDPDKDPNDPATTPGKNPQA